MNVATEREAGSATLVEAYSSAMTILVVDDSENDAALLQLMFRRSRILNPVQLVTSIDAALCYLKGDVIYADRAKYPFPVLLFLDLDLSDGSGFEVLRWLNVHPSTTRPAVVVLSGSDVHAFRQAYLLGADSFLVKPLNFEEFENMVRHVRGIKLTRTSEGHLLEVDS